MVYGLLITIMEAICCMIFFEIFLIKRDLINRWNGGFIIFALGFISVFISAIAGDDLILKSICTIGVIFGFSNAMFKSKGIQKIFLSIIFYAILLCADFFVINILKQIGPSIYNYYSLSALQLFIISIVSKILLLFLINVIKHLWYKINKRKAFLDIKNVHFIYFPILTITMIWFMVYNFSFEENNEFASLFFVLSLGLIILNIIIFFIIKKTVEKEFEIKRNQLMQKEKDDQIKAYKKMNYIFNKQVDFFHDHINHLDCLKGMLKKERAKEAIEYLDKLTYSLYNEYEIVCTNNLAIDVIINQKYSYALSKDISIIMVLSDLSDINIKEHDLVVIVLNLLDNSIEACDKIDGNKTIIFKCVNEKNELLIYVENPINEELKIVDGKILTSKSDKLHHGIGITNITKVIDKYNGMSSFKCMNNNFYFSATIPN